MGFGIGRIPSDVDPVAEALAMVEAAEHQAREEAGDYRRFRCTENIASDGQYRACGSAEGHRRAIEVGLMGCGVMCRVHLEAYFKQLGCSVERAIASKLVVEEDERRNPRPCRECGRKPADWISGAGGYLCSHHAGDY